MPSFRICLLMVTGILLTACAGDDLVTPVAIPTEASAPIIQDWAALLQQSASLAPIRTLTIPTYDGSGQVVHPDIVFIPERWNGWEYWMAFTPYAKADSSLENPSIVVSHDGINWTVPAGLANPLVAPIAKGYNSDPDLTYDRAAGELVLLYREVSGGLNQVKALRSSDGVHWSAPKLLFRRPSHGMVSPSITVTAPQFSQLWYVDAGPSKCVRRTTKVMTQRAMAAKPFDPAAPEQGWSSPQRVALSQPRYYIWHLDVTWIPERKEFWAVYPAYRQRMCGERELFFARSSDGVKWTNYRVPFLRPRDAAWMNMTVYRASSLYDPNRDVIRLWVSASAPGSVWSLSYVEYNFASFLAALEKGVAESPSTPAPGIPTNGLRLLLDSRP